MEERLFTKNRRSSILKQAKSQGIEGLDEPTQEVTRDTNFEKRTSRRVSFADVCQVQEFCEESREWQPNDQGTGVENENIAPVRPAWKGDDSFQALLCGQICNSHAPDSPNYKLQLKELSPVIETNARKPLTILGPQLNDDKIYRSNTNDADFGEDDDDDRHVEKSAMDMSFWSGHSGGSEDDSLMDKEATWVGAPCLTNQTIFLPPPVNNDWKGKTLLYEDCNMELARSNDDTQTKCPIDMPPSIPHTVCSSPSFADSSLPDIVLPPNSRPPSSDSDSQSPSPFSPPEEMCPPAAEKLLPTAVDRLYLTTVVTEDMSIESSICDQGTMFSFEDNVFSPLLPLTPQSSGQANHHLSQFNQTRHTAVSMNLTENDTLSSVSDAFSGQEISMVDTIATTNLEISSDSVCSLTKARSTASDVAVNVLTEMDAVPVELSLTETTTTPTPKDQNNIGYRTDLNRSIRPKTFIVVPAVVDVLEGEALNVLENVGPSPFEEVTPWPPVMLGNENVTAGGGGEAKSPLGEAVTQVTGLNNQLVIDKVLVTPDIELGTKLAMGSLARKRILLLTEDDDLVSPMDLPKITPQDFFPNIKQEYRLSKSADRHPAHDISPMQCSTTAPGAPRASDSTDVARCRKVSSDLKPVQLLHVLIKKPVIPDETFESEIQHTVDLQEKVAVVSTVDLNHATGSLATPSDTQTEQCANKQPNMRKKPAVHIRESRGNAEEDWGMVDGFDANREIDCGLAKMTEKLSEEHVVASVKNDLDHEVKHGEVMTTLTWGNMPKVGANKMTSRTNPFSKVLGGGIHPPQKRKVVRPFMLASSRHIQPVTSIALNDQSMATTSQLASPSPALEVAHSVAIPIATVQTVAKEVRKSEECSIIRQKESDKMSSLFGHDKWDDDVMATSFHDLSEDQSLPAEPVVMAEKVVAKKQVTSIPAKRIHVNEMAGDPLDDPPCKFRATSESVETSTSTKSSSEFRRGSEKRAEVDSDPASPLTVPKKSRKLNARMVASETHLEGVCSEKSSSPVGGMHDGTSSPIGGDIITEEPMACLDATAGSYTGRSAGQPDVGEYDEMGNGFVPEAISTDRSVFQRRLTFLIANGARESAPLPKRDCVPVTDCGYPGDVGTSGFRMPRPLVDRLMPVAVVNTNVAFLLRGKTAAVSSSSLRSKIDELSQMLLAHKDGSAFGKTVVSWTPVVEASTPSQEFIDEKVNAIGTCYVDELLNKMIQAEEAYAKCKRSFPIKEECQKLEQVYQHYQQLLESSAALEQRLKVLQIETGKITATNNRLSAKAGQAETELAQLKALKVQHYTVDFDLKEFTIEQFTTRKIRLVFVGKKIHLECKFGSLVAGAKRSKMTALENRQIVEFKMWSDLPEDADQFLTFTHNMMVTVINNKNVSKTCETAFMFKEALADLSISSRHFRMLQEDLIAIANRHALTIVQEKVTVEFLSLTRFLNFTLDFHVDPNVYPDKVKVENPKVIIGKIRYEDIRTVFAAVKPGPSYISGVVRALDLWMYDNVNVQAS